jgi:hypothetical protein
MTVHVTCVGKHVTHAEFWLKNIIERDHFGDLSVQINPI